MSDIRPSDMDKIINNDSQKEAMKYNMIKYAVNKSKDESDIIDLVEKINSTSRDNFKFTDDELEEIISIATEKFNEKLEKRRQYEIKYLELD